MRNLKWIMSAIILMATLGLSSCEKKTEDPGTTPINSNGTMSLTVDGNDWEASLSVQGVNSNGVINITGSDYSAKQASVILYGVTGAGTFEISSSQQNMLRWTNGLNPKNTFIANGLLGSGSITVTEFTDKKIKGTFYFTGYNTNQVSKTITNGKFEVNF